LLGHGLSPFLLLFSTRNTRTARGYVRLAVGQHLMPRVTRGVVSASERVSRGDQSHTIARRLGPNVRRATETDTARATRRDAYYFFSSQIDMDSGKKDRDAVGIAGRSVRKQLGAARYRVTAREAKARASEVGRAAAEKKTATRN
jgi:hypothetical protein